MRKRGVKSPDHADACMYAQIDYEYYNPFGIKAGDKYTYEQEYGLDEDRETYSSGYTRSI